MVEDFDSIRSQAIKYALDMKQKSTNNSNTSNYQCHNKEPINNIFNSNNKRSGKHSGDLSLILALFLLLSQDGADMPLLLALIYIMT